MKKKSLPEILRSEAHALQEEANEGFAWNPGSPGLSDADYFRLKALEDEADRLLSVARKIEGES